MAFLLRCVVSGSGSSSIIFIVALGVTGAHELFTARNQNFSNGKTEWRMWNERRQPKRD